MTNAIHTWDSAEPVRRDDRTTLSMGDGAAIATGETGTKRFHPASFVVLSLPAALVFWAWLFSLLL